MNHFEACSFARSKQASVCLCNYDNPAKTRLFDDVRVDRGHSDGTKNGNQASNATSQDKNAYNFKIKYPIHKLFSSILQQKNILLHHHELLYLMP